MRIGIDCRNFYDIHLNRGAGVERYTYHLVKNLLESDESNEYVLFFYSDISPETIHKVKAGHSRVKIVKVFKTTTSLPLFDTHFRFASLLKKENLDLAVFPANIIPLTYRRKSILIVHDLAIYLHPEWFPDRQWFSTKILVPLSLKKAQTIVAVSHNTKQDLLKLFDVPQEKIRVIQPGVVIKESYGEDEVKKVLTKFDIKEKYILYLGTIEPRKNIKNLIKAFSTYIFENEESRINLVLAGIKGWKFQPIFQYLQNINQRLPKSPVKYIGKVSNRERNILLKNCEAFVFPSKYEGFGFPVVEAMAMNVPVVTSNNSSLREIAADGAALLVDPSDANEIRRAIKKVVEDKLVRQRLIAKGSERSRQFTWQKTIDKFKIILK